MQDLSYENELDLRDNEPAGGSHFHMNGFARSVVLTQRQKATRKWAISFCFTSDWMKQWREFFKPIV